MAENDSFHGDRWKWETKYLLNDNLIYHTTEDKTLVWEGVGFQTRLWKLAPPFKSFLGGSDSKESACNAGDPGLIPRLGRSLKRMATHSSILAWEIPWTKEPGYSSWGHKESGTTE